MIHLLKVSSLGELRKHKRRYHSKLCDDRFVEKCDLKKHVKLFHSENVLIAKIVRKKTNNFKTVFFICISRNTMFIKINCLDTLKFSPQCKPPYLQKICTNIFSEAHIEDAS